MKPPAPAAIAAFRPFRASEAVIEPIAIAPAMPRTIAVFPSSLILISLCFAQRRSRNSARPRAVRRRVHIDNAAAHAMFLIPTGSRAKDEEHEGVNREKMRRNHGSAAGRGSCPVPAHLCLWTAILTACRHPPARL
jgi:hypothetical protein